MVLDGESIFLLHQDVNLTDSGVKVEPFFSGWNLGAADTMRNARTLNTSPVEPWTSKAGLRAPKANTHTTVQIKENKVFNSNSLQKVKISHADGVE